MEQLTTNEDLERIRSELPALAAAMPNGLQALAPGDPLDDVLAALWRDGAVVLKNAVSGECADRVVAEMTPCEYGFCADWLIFISIGAPSVHPAENNCGAIRLRSYS